MCGILGVVMKQYDPKILHVINQLKIRGTHAYGIAYVESNEIKRCKSNCIEFVCAQIDRLKLTTFIFHNRYSTSGDYKDDNNNQPIIVGDTAMVFNGVISMKTKPEMEQEFDIKMSTDNDGEIMLLKPNEFYNPSASFAGVFLTKSKCYGVRNNKRPMYLYQDENLQILVSTIDTLKRAGFDCTKARIVKPFELVVLK